MGTDRHFTWMRPGTVDAVLPIYEKMAFHESYSPKDLRRVAKNLSRAIVRELDEGPGASRHRGELIDENLDKRWIRDFARRLAITYDYWDLWRLIDEFFQYYHEGWDNAADQHDNPESLRILQRLSQLAEEEKGDLMS